MNLFPDRTARVITLASGKGGVGKTNIAANLALALSRLRRRSLLVDCDLGLGNAATVMGLSVSDTIETILSGHMALDEIVIEGPESVFVVPGDSGTTNRLDLDVRRRLADAFRPHRRSLDYVIVDTPSGAAPDTLDLIAASDMVLLVVAPEPTAFMDAYATAKLLTFDHGVREIAIVANLVDDAAAGRELFRKFRDVAARFLDTRFQFVGSIPRDDKVRLAVMRKRCCIEAFPDAMASSALTRIARTIDDMEWPLGEGGDCFFGMEALLVAQ
jgi:flagellar biosynthesis protein FlhG